MVVAVMAGSKPRPGVSSASAPPPHVYPEGGYGWVIVFAYSLNAVLGTQVLAVFGLAFKDVFVELDMPATDIATIMNLNISFSLLIGLFIGALIRKFGYRKVAVSGAVLVSLGTFLTAFSTNLVEFLLSYGITMASGLGLTSPSFNVALNTYFRERRSLAMGLAMASTGVSGILLPQLVSLLVAEYGARGTYVLLSGLALHALVAAALLQPVAWHRTAKTARPEEDRAEDDEEDPMLDSEFSLPALPVVREETDAELRQDRERLGLGQEAGFTRRRTSTVSSYHTARGPCDSTLWASASLLDLGCSGSVLALDYAAVPYVSRVGAAGGGGGGGCPPGCLPRCPQALAGRRPGPPQAALLISREKTASPVAEEKKPAWHLAEVKANGGSHNLDVEAKDKVDAEAGASPSGPRRRRAAVKRWWLFVVELLDLRLLSSPSMVNLMVAISLAYFAERNFSQVGCVGRSAHAAAGVRPCRPR
ncbi:hypothetical protein ONE63_005404 [Megalurothrips usitatus]|uniref:Major facilitator superfamily (MFS) profile domain-containing protein n=1 Tax=Megalurothrips usitatus TaxID=439358 RepID=A0AAV7Y280_9NEOP|nr:hypothetical protein ONE63_005404 [Megalurothrips usitatus]